MQNDEKKAPEVAETPPDTETQWRDATGRVFIVTSILAGEVYGLFDDQRYPTSMLLADLLAQFDPVSPPTDSEAPDA